MVVYFLRILKNSDTDSKQFVVPKKLVSIVFLIFSLICFFFFNQPRGRVFFSLTQGQQDALNAFKSLVGVDRDAAVYNFGELFVDSLSTADGPVPTYLDLLKVTSTTVANGLTATN